MKPIRLFSLAIIAFASAYFLHLPAGNAQVSYLENQLRLQKNLPGTWHTVSELLDGHEKESQIIITRKAGKFSAVLDDDGEQRTLDSITVFGNRVVMKKQSGSTRLQWEAIETEPGQLVGRWSVRGEGEKEQQKSQGGKWRAAGGSHLISLARSAIREGDLLKKHALTGKLIQSITSQNAKSLAEIIFTPSEALPARELQLLFAYAWARIDGKKAVEELQKMTSSRMQSFAMMHAITGWGFSDPAAAGAWIDEQDEGMTRTKILLRMGLVAGLVASDIDAAILHLERLKGNERELQAAMRMVVRQQIQNLGFEGAGEWASGLKEGAVRTVAQEQIGRDYVRHDPVKAAKWLELRLREKIENAGNDPDLKPIPEAVVSDLAEALTEKNPESALKWALAQPFTIQSIALKEVFSAWTRKDPTAASARLDDLPEGKARDYAISGFTSSLIREDPQAAMVWAESISDAELKKSAVVQIAQYWIRLDAEAAKEALGQSSLDKKTVESILNSLPARVRSRGIGR